MLYNIIVLYVLLYNIIYYYISFPYDFSDQDTSQITLCKVLTLVATTSVSHKLVLQEVTFLFYFI